MTAKGVLLGSCFHFSNKGFFLGQSAQHLGESSVQGVCRRAQGKRGEEKAPP